MKRKMAAWKPDAAGGAEGGDGEGAEGTGGSASVTQEATAISELCEIIAGQHISASLYSGVPDGTPYLTGPADFGDREPVVSKWTNSPKVFANKGDVLVTVKGSGVGKLNLGCDAAIGRQLMAVRPKRGKTTQAYLFSFLRSVEAKVHEMAQGAAIPGITKADIASLTLYAPPLAEQKRIAGILDAADALRAKRRESLAQLDTLLQSTFLTLFGDPVTNPMGWEVVKSANAFSEKPKIGTTRPADGRGYLVVRVGEVGDTQVRFEKCGRVELNQAEFNRYVLTEGDTVIARAIGSQNQLGKASFFGGYAEDVVIDSHVMRLRPDRAVCDPKWFFSLLSSPRGKVLLQRKGGATAVQFNINAKQASDLDIPLPPLALQRGFATIVESIERQKSRLRAHLGELDALFASLQSRAFSGEL